jgi:hypothetical protein
MICCKLHVFFAGGTVQNVQKQAKSQGNDPLWSDYLLFGTVPADLAFLFVGLDGHCAGYSLDEGLVFVALRFFAGPHAV